MSAPETSPIANDATGAHSLHRLVSRRDALKTTLDAFEAFCFIADGVTPEIVEELAPHLRLYKSEYQCLVTLTKYKSANSVLNEPG